MKRIVFFILFILCFHAGYSHGESFWDNVDEIREFNPDINKYDFVKTYISCLKYIKTNVDLKSKVDTHVESAGLTEKQGIVLFLDTLTHQNLNLRVSRNLMKKYKDPDQGLILKVANQYMKFCDEQIQLNNKEKDLLENLYAIYEEQGKTKEEISQESKTFIDQQEALLVQRKESLMSLLETSFLVQKVLISGKTNKFDELYVLGISRNERDKLLEKIDEIFEELAKSKVSAGQSFLEGSISALKKILEDNSWGTLDDT